MPTIIRNTDAAAVSAGAVLTGLAGSLVAVLDYCLVTTLGWTKSFSATNKAVYRAPAGVRHYLDVDDSGPDATALGRNARTRGYEVMTAVATGTGPFPTVAQVATPVVVKSATADATVRPWILIGDDKTFYFFDHPSLASPPVLSTIFWDGGFSFGEIYSGLSGDLYRSFLGHGDRTSAAVAAIGAGGLKRMTLVSGLNAINMNMPRSYTGVGPSVWVTPITNPAIDSTNVTPDHFGGFFVYPNPADGGLYANAVLVGERGAGASPVAANTIRGRLRGVYQEAHYAANFNDQDTFTGVGDFAGKTFMLIKYDTSGTIAFETTAWAYTS